MSDQAAHSTHQPAQSSVASRLSDSSRNLMQQGLPAAQVADPQLAQSADTTSNQTQAQATDQEQAQQSVAPSTSPTSAQQPSPPVPQPHPQPHSQAQPPAQPPAQIPDSEKIAIFEKVLDDAEAQQQPQNPPPTQQGAQTGGVRKEQLEGASTSGAATAELPGGMQYVETEPQAEIPPEVESFLHKSEEHPEQQPTEIVIAEQPRQSYTPPPPKRTVRVLPITKEEIEEGKKLNVQNSFRWLVEFSQKVTKMFTGSVIYREEKK
ncbi:MAG: hypothetical protein WDZ94_01580 [Patescibacteria group bacterium]